MSRPALTACSPLLSPQPFGSNQQPTKVSLLQIATSAKVFLVDMLTLAEHDSDELQAFWHVLSTEIIVVGFGVSGDLTRICQSYPQLSRCLHRAVELQKVLNALISSGALDDSVGRGLGATCQALLGSDVSKTEQTSHWGTRPLTASQRTYAATDAYVLLPLLDAALRAMVGGGGLPAGESLAGSLVKVSQSILKWVRPVAVAQLTAGGEGPSIPQLPPLGRAGVCNGLQKLGLRETCPVFESDNPPEELKPLGIMCKTIALLAHESEVLLCVLKLGCRLQVSRCAAAVGLRRTDVRMAREDELVDTVGYPRGSIGPVGARNGKPHQNKCWSLKSEPDLT